MPWGASLEMKSLGATSDMVAGARESLLVVPTSCGFCIGSQRHPSQTTSVPVVAEARSVGCGLARATPVYTPSVIPLGNMNGSGQADE